MKQTGILLLALLPGALCQTYTRRTGYTLKEDVLIISVASIVPESRSGLVTRTAGDCEAYCSITEGCSSYDFCGSSTACGSHCKSYVADNPALPTNNAMISSPNPAWQLPLTGFGPFVKTTCVGDAWPAGHCALKKTATPGKPVWWDMPATAGYTAGYLPAMPAACEGLTTRACYACQAMTSPSKIAGCLACAKAAKVDALKTIYAGPAKNSRAETCAFCYGNATVTDTAGCSTCLAQSTDDTGMECVKAATPPPSPKPQPQPQPQHRQPPAVPNAPELKAPMAATTPAGSSTSVAPIAAGVAVGLAAIAAIVAFVFCKRRDMQAQAQQQQVKMAPAGYNTHAATALPMSPHGYGIATTPVHLTSLAPSVSDDTASTYSLPTVNGSVAGTDSAMYRI